MEFGRWVQLICILMKFILEYQAQWSCVTSIMSFKLELMAETI